MATSTTTSTPFGPIYESIIVEYQARSKKVLLQPRLGCLLCVAPIKKTLRFGWQQRRRRTPAHHHPSPLVHVLRKRVAVGRGCEERRGEGREAAAIRMAGQKVEYPSCTRSCPRTPTTRAVSAPTATRGGHRLQDLEIENKE